MEVLKAASIRRLPRWQSSLVRTKGWWACHPSRGQYALASRRFTSQPSSPPDKPYYVTTPIFYVNAAPHIGHMYSMVLADVFKRWQILKGNRAIMITGTDEHGSKVQQAAAAQEMNPKQFCDQTAEQFKELAYASGVDYDRFIRTTDQDHIQAVEHFWHLLSQRPDLFYQSTHKGYYSVSDECFYPESQLERRQDPFTGEVFLASAETGSKVEWVEEKNYFFRLTALKEDLRELYRANPDLVQPHARQHEVIAWIENQLTDLCISRPVNRLTWGIRVPNDPSQTIYVWVDALINYLTAAGFPNWAPGREHAGGWPADLQIIGKDIMRFHCIYWPALLMVMGLPLPKKILVHEHWTLNRQKMSKSTGNVVNPLYAISNYGTDAMRFYLMFEGGLEKDADYSNDVFFAKYKKFLQNGMGNLLGRVGRSKLWKLRDIVTRAGSKDEPPVTIDNDKIIEAFQRDQQMLGGHGLRTTVTTLMEARNPVDAIRAILVYCSTVNVFLAKIEPWALVKSGDPNDEGIAYQALYYAAEGLRICGILLQPFLPTKSAQLLDRLGVAKDKRTLEYAELYADYTYGEPFMEVGPDSQDGLFPPLYSNQDFIFKKNIRQDKHGNKISLQDDLKEAIEKLEEAEAESELTEEKPVRE
ncbi:putative methionine--tRNA ligase [Podospora australis]|uniref:Probable methionine--tRNA ligase, mitochondrial n=1 Tax=Podospora australis TaxID=1536484 RepID=A0AAN7ALD2_9PEZI|nr:putative methionine--tRNA ligase [Podospora australis]